MQERRRRDNPGAFAKANRGARAAPTGMANRLARPSGSGVYAAIVPGTSAKSIASYRPLSQGVAGRAPTDALAGVGSRQAGAAETRRRPATAGKPLAFRSGACAAILPSAFA